MKGKIPIISSPIEFQQQYLAESNHIFCPFCFDVSNNTRTNFLQIAPLEQIKNLHKHSSFESVRRKFYTAILLTSGDVKETIGDKTYCFGKNTLYFIADSQLHSIHQWSDDVKGYHCIFDAEYFLLCLKNQVKLSKYPFFQTTQSPCIDLSTEECSVIESLLMKMSMEFSERKTVNDDLLVRLYLNVFLIEAERIYQRKTTTDVGALTRKEQLVAKFKSLVLEHLKDVKQVSEYAERLHVHPHYLSDTVKEILGVSAIEFVNRQVIAEAKARLIQTDDSVVEVAEFLSFNDQSYFTRFFKKHTGLTPTQFREKHGH